MARTRLITWVCLSQVPQSVCGAHGTLRCVALTDCLPHSFRHHVHIVHCGPVGPQVDEHCDLRHGVRLHYLDVDQQLPLLHRVCDGISHGHHGCYFQCLDLHPRSVPDARPWHRPLHCERLRACWRYVCACCVLAPSYSPPQRSSRRTSRKPPSPSPWKFQSLRTLLPGCWPPSRPSSFRLKPRASRCRSTTVARTPRAPPHRCCKTAPRRPTS